MDLNKYLNETAAPETQYSKEEYAAMKKAEREAVWMQVDARMGEVLADAPALQEFLNFMSQCRNSLPNQLLLSGQNADITDARTFQQWKDAGRHIRTGEEGYTAIVGQVYENNGRKASGYNIGKVFDITQTRGRPIPPPAEYQVDELIAATIGEQPSADSDFGQSARRHPSAVCSQEPHDLCPQRHGCRHDAVRHRSGVRTGRFSQGLHLQPPSLRCAELLCRLHGRASVWA